MPAEFVAERKVRACRHFQGAVWSVSGKGSRPVLSNGKVGNVWAESAATSATARAERHCSNDSSGVKTCSKWECVCAILRGVPREAIEWERRTKVALYGCLMR